MAETPIDETKFPNVHRMNLCIEVPAIPNMEKAGLISFYDMLRYLQALAEQSNHDAKGEIGGARFAFSTEWNVQSNLKGE